MDEVIPGDVNLLLAGPTCVACLVAMGFIRLPDGFYIDDDDDYDGQDEDVAVE